MVSKSFVASCKIVLLFSLAMVADFALSLSSPSNAASTLSYENPTIANKYYDDFVKTLPSMVGKKVAITGCTSGTGLIAAKTCAALGATVIMLNRSSSRSEKAEQEVKKAINGDAGSVITIPCDLQSLESVGGVAALYREAFPNDESGLDVLCCNAGIMAVPDKATGDGFDVQMQTNHLSHFKLVSDLMPELKKAATVKGEARVVQHTSNARGMPMDNDGTGLKQEYFEQKGGNLGGDDGSWTRYGQSKLANAVFCYALKDKLAANEDCSKILSLVAHPGLSATNLQVTTANEANGQGMADGLADLMKGAQSAEDGTMPLLSCICKEGVKSGEFFGPSDMGSIGPGTSGKAITIEPESYCTDETMKANIWTWSEAAIGPFFKE